MIAIETARDSCERLRDLIRHHGLANRCILHQAAPRERFRQNHIDMNAGSQFRVTGRGGLGIPALTLDSLVAAYQTIDLLKMDVEDAEYQTLAAAGPEILDRIRRIEMEY